MEFVRKPFKSGLSGNCNQYINDKSVFFTGNWQNARTAQENFLNGILLVARRDFFNVNGYSEYITTYGWDDSDIYKRLLSASYEQKFITNDYVKHLPHERERSASLQLCIQYNRILSHI